MLDFKFRKKHLLILLLFCSIIIPPFFLKPLYSLPIALIIGFLLIKDKRNTFKLSLLDIGIAILFFSEFVTMLFSSYSFNSLDSITRMTFISISYLFYKFYAKKENYYFLFFMFFFILSSVLVIFTSSYFKDFSVSIYDNGFENVSDFKNLYSPIGRISNSWGTALLLMIPFNLVFLLKLKKIEDKFLLALNLSLSVFCLIVSFSRGIYLSAVFFILFLGITSFRFFKIKQFIVLSVLTLFMLTASVIIVKDSFLTTVKFNKTISQKRSTEGRTTLWKHSLDQFKEKPIFGFGQKNYIISKENNPLVSEDVVFNNRTNNTYIQLLIERGIFGIFSYLLFFIIVIKVAWNKFKLKSTSKQDKIQILIIISGLLAFLLREFTFSSFLDSNFVNIVAFHLVFLLIPFDTEIRNFSISKWYKKGVIYLGVVLFLVIALLNVKKNITSNYNKKFISAYNDDDIKLGIESLEKAISLNPNNLTLLKHKALAFSKNTLNINISSENQNLLKINVSNRDSLNESKKILLEILLKRPNNHETIHNLGWLFMSEKKFIEAEKYFDKALSLNSYITEYQCSLVLCKIAQSQLQDAIIPLSKALQYSPDLLESTFYLELQNKYSSIAKKAKLDAISILKAKLKINENNPIYMARLARLILNEDSKEALNLLTLVNNNLPNLNRPWLYKGYLKTLENDSVSVNEYFQKAKFLKYNDYLTFLYDGNFQRKIGNDEDAIKSFERVFEIYKSVTSSSYIPSWYRISPIKNSVIPKELLHYTKPKLDNQRVFKYLEEYYKKNDDKEKEAKYRDLHTKYQNNIFMGVID